jgi:hypothetical protein
MLSKTLHLYGFEKQEIIYSNKKMLESLKGIVSQKFAINKVQRLRVD